MLRTHQVCPLGLGLFSSAGKGEESAGKQTLQEEARVNNGLVLPFPDTVELQKGRCIQVVQHGNDLLPAVAFPETGREGLSRHGCRPSSRRSRRAGTPLSGNQPRMLFETPKPPPSPATELSAAPDLTWRDVPPSGPG